MSRNPGVVQNNQITLQKVRLPEFPPGLILK